MAVRTFPGFDGVRRRQALPRVAIIGAGVAGLGIGWPLVLAGGLKAVYDLLLLAMFRNLRPPEEAR
jgi:hypothetical protein